LGVDENAAMFNDVRLLPRSIIEVSDGRLVRPFGYLGMGTAPNLPPM
jgi:hypothetical protein